MWALVQIRRLLLFLLAWALLTKGATAEALRLGTFDIDATPPVGSPLAYDTMEKEGASLRLKGAVLLGSGQPIVLVAVDWIGIGGEGQTAFRQAIAEEVGTTPERVAVHCLHQHDAPRFDLGTEYLLAEQGLSGAMFDVAWVKETIRRAAGAAKNAAAHVTKVTHIGLGQARVEKVASNRRILGDDGKVLHTRWTATRDASIRAFPEGTIDPVLKSISFYSDDELLAVITYYATHPQSFYRTRSADPDFPGMARERRQEEVGAIHLHFNGAGGNIGAGKYNDGSPENRPVLAARMAKGMADALAAAEKQPITADAVSWSVEPVALPLASHLDEKTLEEKLRDKLADKTDRISAAKALALVRRTQAGEKTDVGCLSLGTARVLHMPGELFVEYQLNAAKLRPDLFIAMAAYGDYAPGYIGTEVAYTQGGYEVSEQASRVAPEVESVLMNAVGRLLGQAKVFDR